jgi:hypothetical protein
MALAPSIAIYVLTMIHHAPWLFAHNVAVLHSAALLVLSFTGLMLLPAKI